MASVAIVITGQPVLGAPTDGGTVTTSAVPRSFPSASVGAFSPWAMSARSDTQSGLIRFQGGFDGGRRDTNQPADETEWDLVAGPTAVLSLGPVAFTATAGISAAKLPVKDTAQVGALLLIGVGTTF
jgi:hypothetical protein